MVAVRYRQVSTASRFPSNRPTIRLKASAPHFTKSGPIMNSVPAVCSPAYMPQNALGPLSALAGTRCRSYSLEADSSSSSISRSRLFMFASP